jgi:ribosome-binding protein aMBF1 (putative translation factor)
MSESDGRMLWQPGARAETCRMAHYMRWLERERGLSFGDYARAARGLLNWTVKTLAKNARLGEATITRFETGKATPNRATLTVIQLAFEQAGVEFTNDDAPGVRMRKRPSRG